MNRLIILAIVVTLFSISSCCAYTDTRCQDLSIYEKEQMCRGLELEKRFNEWNNHMKEN
jgi:hypothetical protein